MKKVIFYTSLFCGIALFACNGSRRLNKDASYVPFTSGLEQKILHDSLDLKKVQFFVDQKLVLKRSLGSQKTNIKSGVIVFENGEYINEIVIPKYTPGIIENVDGNHLMVSFEVKNNNIEFGPGKYTPNYFMLYAKTWNNGAGQLTYDNENYRVTCGSCDNASIAKLVVRKKQADDYNNHQRIVKGRKVDN